MKLKRRRMRRKMTEQVTTMKMMMRLRELQENGLRKKMTRMMMLKPRSRKPMTMIKRLLPARNPLANRLLEKRTWFSSTSRESSVRANTPTAHFLKKLPRLQGSTFLKYFKGEFVCIFIYIFIFLYILLGGQPFLNSYLSLVTKRCFEVDASL